MSFKHKTTRDIAKFIISADMKTLKESVEDIDLSEGLSTVYLNGDISFWLDIMPFKGEVGKFKDEVLVKEKYRDEFFNTICDLVKTVAAACGVNVNPVFYMAPDGCLYVEGYESLVAYYPTSMSEEQAEVLVDVMNRVSVDVQSWIYDKFDEYSGTQSDDFSDEVTDDLPLDDETENAPVEQESDEDFGDEYTEEEEGTEGADEYTEDEEEDEEVYTPGMPSEDESEDDGEFEEIREE
jgi:hypothetical protein